MNSGTVLIIEIGGMVEIRRDTVSFSSSHIAAEYTYDMNSLQVVDMMYEIGLDKVCICCY